MKVILVHVYNNPIHNLIPDSYSLVVTSFWNLNDVVAR